MNSLKYFEFHLLGREFIVQTDHLALRYLQNSNYMLTRWALALQQFDFDVMHRPGTLHGYADGLLRQAWESAEQEDGAESNQPNDVEADVGAAATTPTPGRNHLVTPQKTCVTLHCNTLYVTHRTLTSHFHSLLFTPPP